MASICMRGLSPNRMSQYSRLPEIDVEGITESVYECTRNIRMASRTGNREQIGREHSLKHHPDCIRDRSPVEWDSTLVISISPILQGQQTESGASLPAEPPPVSVTNLQPHLLHLHPGLQASSHHRTQAQVAEAKRLPPSCPPRENTENWGLLSRMDITEWNIPPGSEC